MNAELDHLFVCVSAGAPEAQLLAEFGLTEGTPNEHPGQGTACRRFFFGNAYLELLWVTDPAAAQAAPVRPTGLWGRWSRRTGAACPFGLCFRPVSEAGGSCPFESWEYRPPYLPAGLTLRVGNNAKVITEPGLFYFHVKRRPDGAPPERRQPLEHSVGFKQITRLRLEMPPREILSQELSALITAGLVHFQPGARYQVELGFDGERCGERKDLHPVLPLAFCW